MGSQNFNSDPLAGSRRLFFDPQDQLGSAFPSRPAPRSEVEPSEKAKQEAAKQAQRIAELKPAGLVMPAEQPPVLQQETQRGEHGTA